MARRQEILNGQLYFPQQMIGIMGIEDNDNMKEIVYEFWNSIWRNFLRERTTDTLIWYDRFNNRTFFNTLLFHLSKAGWITSVVDNNYAFLTLNESKLMKWITREELSNIRFRHKFEHYRYRKTKSTLTSLVKINDRYEETGIVRKGFCKAGNNVFQYSESYMNLYLEKIALNLKKGLEPTNNDISYQEIIDELVNYYAIGYNNYTLGNNISDSRGRAIFQCTKKLFNPVSSKDARALMLIPGRELTNDGFRCIYAFIAELLGYRGKNINDKIAYGEHCFITEELPDISDMDSSGGYDDLHKSIWLQRIYANLRSYETDKRWYIPIEIDAQASILEYIAVLTNDHQYMDLTNMINADEFKDAWYQPYCSRTHVKKALTPILYGSSKKPRELWDKAKLSYDTQQLIAITKEINVGIYRNAAKFRDFIISNVIPQKRMHIELWNDSFWIECNRFQNEETEEVSYPIYTSHQGLVKRVVRHLNRVPDLKAFKRYFVTLLCHGLDSQVADNICKKVDWIIPNHDSFLCHPNDVGMVRSLYTDNMMAIYRNRKDILRRFFNSIGITDMYPEKPDGEVTGFSGYCLK